MLLEVNEYTDTNTCIHIQLSSAGSTFMDSTNHRFCAMFEIYRWLNLLIQTVWVKRDKYRTWECMGFDNCGNPRTNLPRDDCTSCRFVLTFTRHSFKYLHTWIHSILIKTVSYYYFMSCMDVRVGLLRKLSTEELMLLNCGVGEDSWESLGLQGDPTSPS